MGEEQRVIKPHNTADGFCMFLIAYCQEDKKMSLTLLLPWQPGQKLMVINGCTDM